MVWRWENVTDAHKVQPLADALAAWIDTDMSCPSIMGDILQDAIRQATKAETIEWLAAIAERYGFKPPGAGHETQV